MTDKRPTLLAFTQGAETDSTYGSIYDLAQMVLGEENSDVLPSCTFLTTPWTDELPDSGGHIMIAEAYNRIYGQVKDLHSDTRSPGVIVEGQSGIGTYHF